jgi:L-lactate dehydrogenase complex protein LldG
MNTARDAFLNRVRQAVAEGNRAGSAADLEARGRLGEQGAGPDPVARFGAELTAAGGQCHLVADREAAKAQVLDLVRAQPKGKILLGKGRLLETLDLFGPLQDSANEVTLVDALPGEATRSAFFGADIGISGVEYLIAETGSLVVRSDLQPRSLSLLPPIHIAVAERSQLLDDLFELFRIDRGEAGPPSALTLITGPSKTGDIELRLVTGVHGPGVVHVVLCTQETMPAK